MINGIEIRSQNNERDWKMIRTEVFVEEQGFQMEFDEIDAIARHITVYINGVPAACGRTFPSGENGRFILGRIAVRRPFRGEGLGRTVMQALEQEAALSGAKEAEVSAQQRAAGFYRALGYTECKGSEHMDEHVLHITMRKNLR